MVACLVAVNAVSLGLLAVSALSWDGSVNEKKVSTVVLVVEVVAIFGEWWRFTCGACVAIPSGNI